MMEGTCAIEFYYFSRCHFNDGFVGCLSLNKLFNGVKAAEIF